MASEELSPPEEMAGNVRSQYLMNLVESEKGFGDGPMGTHKTVIGPMIMNAPVSVLASLLIWGISAWCMFDSESSNKTLKGMQSAVTQQFTWGYIGSNGIWLFFTIAVYIKFGHVKLGKDDDKPEFSDANYFMLIFCAGVAIGLIFFGAAEPVTHYVEGGGNRDSSSGYKNQNEMATNAINITLYHWGVHGWVVYSLTAVCLGVLAYRYDLPLTYRTCFFPLFGKATWGWFGDMLDIMVVAGSIAGVCTSLGLGAKQTVTGMQRIGWLPATCETAEQPACTDTILESDLPVYQCGVIAIITLMATVSVLSGLDKGVKLLSQVAFISGMFLLVVVFWLDDPAYLLNVMVQAFGVYIQWIMQLGWFTDAFAQLPWGLGHANDDAGAVKEWMNWWTIFYWGWWIAWSPFVGIFLARISKGRTIAEVINFTWSVPLFYCILWFCCFGGAGIKMHRRAEFLMNAGTELYGSPTHFLDTSISRGNCYVVPETLPCPAPGQNFSNADLCPKWTNDEYVANTNLSPVCMLDDSDGFWFDLMNQYYGIGPMLASVSIFTIGIYFITSSDSGSMVVDLVASNGEEAHAVQRVYWAFTEGGLAVALLVAGGTDGLGALQAASIVTGVPFTFAVCLICLSLWRTLQYDQGLISTDQYNSWSLPLYAGIFDILEHVFTGLSSPMPDMKHVVGFLTSLVCPPYVIHQTLSMIPDSESTEMVTFGAALSWVGVITCFLVSFWVPAFSGFTVFCYCAFLTCVMIVRAEVRYLYNTDGGPFEDLCASFFVYPQAVWQARAQLDVPIAQKGNDAKKALLQENDGIELHEV